MKKFLILLALAAVSFGALAWDVTVPASNQAVTVLMVVPPVVDTPYSGIAQLPVRSTGVVVAAGAKYRIANQVIVAAHAGTITNQLVAAYYTNGLVVALADAQWAATNGIAVVTNLAVAPITVPVTGISGYDGTVRWYRARPTNNEDVRLQVVYGGSDTVVLQDSVGDALRYAASGSVDFLDFTGAMYVKQLALGTNSVRVLAW